MKKLPSIKKLSEEYGLSIDELIKIMYDCFKYHLSRDELKVFIENYYFKLEMRLNKKYQR